jgi:hypothetical protein
LTVAHFESDYHSTEVFLTALCPTCHNRLDAPYRVRSRRRRARVQQEQAGQQAIFAKGEK